MINIVLVQIYRNNYTIIFFNDAAFRFTRKFQNSSKNDNNLINTVNNTNNNSLINKM